MTAENTSPASPAVAPLSISAPPAATVTDGGFAPPAEQQENFLPIAPSTIEESGLRDVDIESLVLKVLYTNGTATGREIAEQLKLRSGLLRDTIDRLKSELLIGHKGAAALGDFVFQLTENGIQLAKHYSASNSYCGAAPVSLDQYIESVHRQTLVRLNFDLERFRSCLSDLSIDSAVASQLAQAVHAGRGLFLYGPPGNGKTSVAERLSHSYSSGLWIPRALTIGGSTIRLFDPALHEVLPWTGSDYGLETDEIDRRWVLIRRPTIVVGGELTLDHLEIQPGPSAGVLEAPVQMKSNGGTLVIDDFGRQRVSPTDILNRWIVPLEKRHDYLSLPNGRQIQVPFDQNLVLATNLEPHDLVDEAFLRRIPYKIELQDPNEDEFRSLFDGVAAKFDVQLESGVIDYLIETYYRNSGLPFRYCHARDLLFQVRNLCDVHALTRTMTKKNVDVVVRNYFGEIFPSR